MLADVGFQRWFFFKVFKNQIFLTKNVIECIKNVIKKIKTLNLNKKCVFRDIKIEKITINKHK